MKTALGCLVVAAALSLNAFAQGGASSKPAVEKPPAAETTPMELAKAAIAAHGGDKFKHMKSMIVVGTVDVTGAFSQVIPATFKMVIAGERYMFELNNPIQPLKQVFDGKQKYSSGYELPPVTSLGFPLLPRAGEEGYTVSALPEVKKKRKGFRVTTPEGFYTDFLIDEKTGQIKGFESSYDVNGRIATTSVAIDEFQTIDGVILPKKYSQRLDLGQMTAYANYNCKQTLVNSPIPDDVFAIPR